MTSNQSPPARSLTGRTGRHNEAEARRPRRRDCRSVREALPGSPVSRSRFGRDRKDPGIAPPPDQLARLDQNRRVRCHVVVRRVLPPSSARSRQRTRPARLPATRAPGQHPVLRTPARHRKSSAPERGPPCRPRLHPRPRAQRLERIAPREEGRASQTLNHG